MNPQAKKSWMYEILSIITWKPRKTIIIYFYRNQLSITNKNHIFQYLSKYSLIKANKKFKKSK